MDSSNESERLLPGPSNEYGTSSYMVLKSCIIIIINTKSINSQSSKSKMK